MSMVNSCTCDVIAGGKHHKALKAFHHLLTAGKHNNHV
jgi:hypothetical protein